MRALLIFFIFCTTLATAQLPQLFVERYYIADDNDATDVTGGGISVGTNTYRIFVILPPSSELVAIYGDSIHPFEISSTSTFFNNIDGSTFGYQIPKVAYESNTVALDSYITLGQVGFQGALKFFGIPKYRDGNGSVIGGVNNDGGSEVIAQGLLTNDSIDLGIPLTIADGMEENAMVVTDWFNYGVLDFQSGEDTTIFGFGNDALSFRSQNFTLSNSGVQSMRDDTSHVLIAQLTTAGEFHVAMNIMVREWVDSVSYVRKYVATNEITSDDEIFVPEFNYPPVCGCTDPSFLEFSADYVCSAEGACVTPIVLGCMDSLACNYDPTANVNLRDVCCYPGNCFGRDIEEVCPQLKGDSFDFSIFPNPTDDNASIQVLSGIPTNVKIEVINQNGIVQFTSYVSNAPLNYTLELDADQIPAGVYFVQVTTDFDVQHKLLVRL